MIALRARAPVAVCAHAGACVLAMQRETDARACVASLGPILQLTLSPYCDASTLRLAELFELLMKMIRVGKLQPSMKGKCVWRVFICFRS